MKLTPIDIVQQQFRKTLFGVDPKEVESFLNLVAEHMSELGHENNEFRLKQRRLEQELHEHRDREEALREAMLTAQRAIDDIREQAKKEAQLVVSEAELRAEKIVHHAHSRVTKIVDEINELRRQKVRAIEELRGILETHAKILDTYSQEQLASEVEEGSITVLERVRAPAPPVSKAELQS